ncbi:MAG TPA: hypothetical protein VN247_05245 [Arenimonas sp.]|nr:hypothetical protein [Arenimonas sp.]
MPHKWFHIVLVTTLIAMISNSPARAVAPSISDSSSADLLANLADNPYFIQGMKAKASGLMMVTITIPCLPLQTLSDRMNTAHLGMGHSGWQLSSQSPIDVAGSTTHVLLTYRR